MKQISAAMFLTAALSLGVSAFAQTTPTNPTGQVDQPTGQAAPQKPADLKDVPAGHWAQEAIKIAADCGIIRGYPDGTFRGNQPITRYEAAAIVARLIAAVKSGACGIGTVGTAGFMITEEQWNDVQSAIQELQADLAQLGEPFFRPDTSRQRSTGGVGLGLHLCKLVAQAHGGMLGFRNAAPGLEARVVLPLA